tara:strand:+ start:136 stop:1452 length:1317 start_codon:yes stop_codon:yes gene_type:complete
MKILILDIYPKKNYRIIKDTNGQYGTGNDFGNSLFTRILKYFTRKNLFWPPIYVAYTMAVLKNRGHEVEYSYIFKENFDYYIFTSSIVSHETELNQIRQLSEKGKKIISIGPFAANNPEEYLKAGSNVIVNEPEFFLLKNDISNIEFNYPQILNDIKLNTELDSLPMPLWNFFIEKKILTYGLIRKKTTIPILATRGCPYSCFHYCVYPLSQGRKVRSMSPKKIVEEIKYWIDNYNISSFVFRDPVFSINRKHTIELCNEIIKSNLKIEFNVETHLNNLDDEISELLVKAGMTMIKVGIESVDSNVLKSSKRKTIETDVQLQKIRKIEKLKVKVVTMYIIGMVGDSIKTVNDTINYAKKLNTYISQFSIFTPYPGTPLFDEYKNIINTKKFEDFNQYNLVFNHANFDNQLARKMMDKAYNNFFLRFSWILKFIACNLR